MLLIQRTYLQAEYQDLATLTERLQTMADRLLLQRASTRRLAPSAVRCELAAPGTPPAPAPALEPRNMGNIAAEQQLINGRRHTARRRTVVPREQDGLIMLFEAATCAVGPTNR